jgi:quinol monooxygenase YgiN
MIVCTLVLKFSGSDRPKVIASLIPLLGSTRAQPGCVTCSLLSDVEDPETLVLHEEWDSREQLDRHLASAEYRLILAAIDLSRDEPRIHFDTVAARAGLEIVEAVRLHQ